MPCQRGYAKEDFRLLVRTWLYGIDCIAGIYQKALGERLFVCFRRF